MLHMTDCKKTAKAKTENTQKLYEDQFQITELQFDPSLSVTSQVQEKKKFVQFHYKWHDKNAHKRMYRMINNK